MKTHEETAGHPPRLRRPQLGSLRGVRNEMARLYQAALSGELDPAKASRLVYVLREVRACLESEALTRLEARLAELTTPKGVIRGTVENRAHFTAH